MGLIQNDRNESDLVGSENKKENEPSALGDSLSFLRFLRGNKSKRLEISPSGKLLMKICLLPHYFSADAIFDIYII
jgi:hypothetical protein